MQNPVWMEKVTGVKHPYAAAAFEVYFGAAVFLFVILWPHLSLTNMIRGACVAAFWVSMGIARYVREVSRSR